MLKMTRRVACLSLTLALAAAGCSGAPDQEIDGLPGDDSVGETSDELALKSSTLWMPLWTGLTSLPVCFTNGTTAQRTNVRTVAEGSWEAIGATTVGLNGRYGVDFTTWNTCPATTTGTIRITFNTSGTNAVTGLGRTHQKMELDTSAPNDTIMHEFGHALGYTHEFLRSDYSSVDPTCTASGGTVPDLGITTPDTSSIMNYRQCGRTGSLTLGDILAHASLYGPWTVAYGSTLAIRHDTTTNFVRGDSTPDVSSASIASTQEFTLVKVSSPSSTGSVSFGDSVRIRTSDGQFLKSNGRNALVTKVSSTSSATTWQIFGRISGDVIRVNDEVLFRASDLAYLRVDSTKRLTTDVGEFFRFVSLGNALNL